MVRVAAAPVNFGITSWPFPADKWHPSPESFLDDLVAAGYEGTDLGPAGYLAPLKSLHDKLRQKGLGLAGGYVEVDVSAPHPAAVATAQVLQLLDYICTTQALWAGLPPELWPKPTLGLGIGSATPTRAERHQAQLWRNAEKVLQIFSKLCGERRLEPCVHNEYGTLVARAADVEQALSCSDVSFCLDTGHCCASGERPLEMLRTFRSRLRHIHLKDFKGLGNSGRKQRTSCQAGQPGGGQPVYFCRLGEGDAQVAAVVGELKSMAYRGWLVVEQDVAVETIAQYAKAKRDQTANRCFLKNLGV